MFEPDFSEPSIVKPRLTARSLGLILLFYLGCLFIATYPAGLTLTSRLVGTPCDPMQALWILRWYKECLVQGQAPWLCPYVQYPTGAALGNCSPFHLQALMYLPLSTCIDNDILCYNIIWLFNVIFAGIGAFLLIWQVLRDRLCACFGGLLAMLSGPMLLHGHGHLELIALGSFPLFLSSWIYWVDAPSSRRLLLAVGAYLLVALSAAYFAVFATVPAILYVVWGALQNGRTAVWPWLRSRIRPLFAFIALTLPCLLFLFANQIWSHWQGFNLPRPKSEFEYYRAPLWSWAVPSSEHLLGRWFPWDLYHVTDVVPVEGCSYVGIVALALIGYAIWSRCAFSCSRYWWTLGVVLVVLSLGACWRIGHVRISLPGEWLWHIFPIFRMIRAPARFNLCAVVCSSLLAAVGLRQLLLQLSGRYVRYACFGLGSALVLADLAMIPYPTSTLPDVPACYTMLCQRNHRPTVVDVPQYSSETCAPLNALCAYWQSRYHGTTTAGYTGFGNLQHEHAFYKPSPFAATLLQREEYLKDPESVSIDLVCQVRFVDYAWLYMSVHHLDYLVLHRDSAWVSGCQGSLSRLDDLLQHAAIYRDADTVVYERTLLAPPERPVLLCRSGWRQRGTWRERTAGILDRVGHLSVYNPDPSVPLCFILEGIALHRAQTLRLRSGDEELARWQVTPEDFQTYQSGPIHLPSGLSDLVLESDGEEYPTRTEQTWDRDPRPYSLHVASVRLMPISPSNP